MDNTVEAQFEELDHTADIAIRVWGEDLPELFVAAAYGMAAQLADVDEIRLEADTEVEVAADDVDRLLVEWLSELLYLGKRLDVVFTEFDVLEFSVNGLRALARGGRVQEYQTHIKAVTFSELDIRETDKGYETVIVFDV